MLPRDENHSVSAIDPCSIFAESPAAFADCGAIIPCRPYSSRQSNIFGITNAGLQIELPLENVIDGTKTYLLALLNCFDIRDPSLRLALPLQLLGSVDAGSESALNTGDSGRRVFIRRSKCLISHESGPYISPRSTTTAFETLQLLTEVDDNLRPWQSLPSQRLIYIDYPPDCRCEIWRTDPAFRPVVNRYTGNPHCIFLAYAAPGTLAFLRRSEMRVLQAFLRMTDADGEEYLAIIEYNPAAGDSLSSQIHCRLKGLRGILDPSPSSETDPNGSSLPVHLRETNSTSIKSGSKTVRVRRIGFKAKPPWDGGERGICFEIRPDEGSTPRLWLGLSQATRTRWAWLVHKTQTPSFLLGILLYWILHACVLRNPDLLLAFVFLPLIFKLRLMAQQPSQETIITATTMAISSLFLVICLVIQFQSGLSKFKLGI